MDSFEEDSPPDTPPQLSPSTLPAAQAQEVSMVEEEEVTGVTFTPELWMQRRHWALQTLRKEGVRSVLDIGCGTGVLLETLVIPPSTIYEPPIRAAKRQKRGSQLPSPEDSGDEEIANNGELFIERLGAIDPVPSVIPSALAIMSPPSSSSSSFPPSRPRWAELRTELWLGGIEKYNSKMEGYEAITMLEVIEHLDPHVLSRFGVVTLGTYRPRLLLVTTPNFDFNAKFPQHHDHEHGKKGFVDPTGRTERVFRHSDHKLEMTSGEFREWATVAASDWGYEVELGGVGISSKPSYYPADDPHLPNQPIYATQTAIFRLASAPARSPRSVRSTPLPFMPGSKESLHSHKLVGKFTHPITAPGVGQRQTLDVVKDLIRRAMQEWNIGEVTLNELWGVDEVAGACAGSKRYLCGVLGGWGDCQPVRGADDEFVIGNVRDRGLTVRWRAFVSQSSRREEEGSWGSQGDVESAGSKGKGKGNEGGW